MVQDQVQKWLDRPNMLEEQVFGLICEVGGLGVGDTRRGRVEQLVRVAVGGKVEANVVSIEDIYTERNLLGDKKVASG